MDDRKVVFISFWTTKYEKAAARLKKSLDRFGLVNDIQQMPDNGWQWCVRHKPDFILEMLRKHPDAYAVVWIDADGDVVARPAMFFEMTEELGAHFKPWPHKNKEELLSGTLFVRNTPTMIVAMEKWIEALKTADSSLSTPEQSTLHLMLPGLGITYKKLPEPYCRILRDRGRTGAPEDSVIVHYQFSRETRYDRTPASHLNAETKLVGQLAKQKKETLQVTRRSILESKLVKASGKVREVKVEEPRERVPAAVRNTLRRKQILALRSKNEKETVESNKVQKALLLAAGHRVRLKRMVELNRRKTGEAQKGCVGGVVGFEPTAAQVALANMEMASMLQPRTLDGTLPKGCTVIVMGNSPTISLLDVPELKKYPTVGCNRALKYKKFWPNYLVIADREPYCQERDEGRLEEASTSGVHILLSDSIFAPDVLLRGPHSNLNRRAQPTPEFDAYVYKIGPRKKKWTYNDVENGTAKLPVNTYSFEAPLVSGLNIACSMLQVAAILGASRIATIGIELKWESEEKSHFFGSGKEVGAYPQDGALGKILAAMKQIKAALKESGIEVVNLSPDKKCPFASVFGNYPLDQFLSEPVVPWSGSKAVSMDINTTIGLIMDEAGQPEL